MAKQSFEEERQDLINNLEGAFASWDTYFEVGGFDPFWEDGLNMNLLRNRIAYYKRRLKEMCSPALLPSLFWKKSPPEMDSHFMAQAAELCEQGEALIRNGVLEPEEAVRVRGYLEKGELVRLRNIVWANFSDEERKARIDKRNDLYLTHRRMLRDEKEKKRTATQLSLI